jgi:hypothetical protein
LISCKIRFRIEGELEFFDSLCSRSVLRAVEFILQSLVEAKRRLFDKKVFVCDAGNPASFIEVTKRLANLYGRQLGAYLVVKYTKPPNETEPMEGPNYLNQCPNISRRLKLKEQPGYK